jgi:hypothetical protein
LRLKTELIEIKIEIEDGKKIKIEENIGIGIEDSDRN